MSFPAYDEYKDSGVAWLGEVPLHWDVAAIKHIVSTPVTDGPHETPEFIDEGIPFVSAEAVSSGEINFAKIRGFISQADHDRYCQKYKPEVGDVYMVKSGASTGTTAIVEDDREFGIWSPLAAIRCAEESHPRFVLNFLRSRNFQEGVTLNWSFGTQQNIGMNVIENLQITRPPIDEQKAISSFLDVETSKIDDLVAEQRRLIELLKEKRQAVISHLVTKGLDPNVPMKPSGIEWMGEVPEHWEVVKVRRALSRIEQGWSPQCDSRPANDNEWGVLKTGCVNRGVFQENENKALPQECDPMIQYEVRPGDVLMSRASGSPELVGATAFVHCVRPRLMISDKTFRLYFEKSIVPEFFVAAFNSHIMRFQIEQSISGAEGLANNLPQSKLLAFALVLPPGSEQQQIVRALRIKEQRYNALIAEATRAIELLQERRTALISAAVTGKIDVRALASQEAA